MRIHKWLFPHTPRPKGAVLGVACHPTHNILASSGLAEDPTVRLWFEDPVFSGSTSAAGAATASKGPDSAEVGGKAEAGGEKGAEASAAAPTS